MSDSWITAAELEARQAKDPKFQEMMAQKERDQAIRMGAIKEAEAPILNDLGELGLHVSSVEELLIPPLRVEVLERILQWLPKVKNETVIEFLVRAVGVFQGRYDGRPLIEAFEQNESEILRWVIANTISITHPTGINDWLVAAVRDPASGKAREMLAVAVGHLVPEVATDVLAPLFPEFPIHVALSMGQYGGQAELDFLDQARTGPHKKWAGKEIDKAIRRIGRRLQKQGQKRHQIVC